MKEKLERKRYAGSAMIRATCKLRHSAAAIRGGGGLLNKCAFIVCVGVYVLIQQMRQYNPILVAF